MSWTRRTGAGERGSERGTIGGRAGDDRGGANGVGGEAIRGWRAGDGEQVRFVLMIPALRAGHLSLWGFFAEFSG